MAGLIKAVLALEHEEIPPKLHLRELNPPSAWDGLPVRVATRAVPWRRNGTPRIAGVSSFGFSGTNAHVVVEEAPATAERGEHGGGGAAAALLVLSAKGRGGAAGTGGSGTPHTWDETQDEPARTCATRRRWARSHFEHRAGGGGGERGAGGRAAGGVHAGRSRRRSGQRGPRRRRALEGGVPVHGAGSQYAGMGRGCSRRSRCSATALERCAEILKNELERPLLSVLYPAEGEASPLDETAYTQPALFAVEYALAELWRSWGVEPDVGAGAQRGRVRGGVRWPGCSRWRTACG